MKGLTVPGRPARRPRARPGDEPDRRSGPHLALQRPAEATASYEAGDSLLPGAGVDPPGLPAPLRTLAVAGDRGTMIAVNRGRPAMWAAGPADGGRALAVEVGYSQRARTIEGLDRAILWSSGLAIGATLLVGAFAVTG